VGDPLYRPFAKSLAGQVTTLRDRADSAASYVALRETNFLFRTDAAANALAWLTRAAREHPGLALSLRLAQEHWRAGDRDAARRALSLFKVARGVATDEIGVMAEAAELLVAMDAPVDALDVYRLVLELPDLPDVWRRHLLPGARAAAQAADAPTLQRRWTEELERLP
jgi:hypothetical protein